MKTFHSVLSLFVVICAALWWFCVPFVVIFLIFIVSLCVEDEVDVVFRYCRGLLDVVDLDVVDAVAVVDVVDLDVVDAVLRHCRGFQAAFRLLKVGVSLL